MKIRESRLHKAEKKGGPGAAANAAAAAKGGKGKDAKGKGKGSKGKDGKGKGGGGKASDAPPVQCSHCHKAGHTADRCWSNPASPSFRGIRADAAPAARAAAEPAAAPATPASVANDAGSVANLSSVSERAARSQVERILSAMLASSRGSGGAAIGAAARRRRGRLLDSGCTTHISGTRSGRVAPARHAMELDTVSGTVTLDSAVTEHNGQLGPITAYLSEGSPDTVSLGQLLEEGDYLFTWSSRDHRNPRLVRITDGSEVRLGLDANCPVVLDEPDTAMAAALPAAPSDAPAAGPSAEPAAEPEDAEGPPPADAVEEAQDAAEEAADDRRSVCAGPHDLLHLPADPERCETCRVAKIARRPFQRKEPDSRDVAERYGDRIHWTPLDRCVMLTPRSSTCCVAEMMQ